MHTEAYFQRLPLRCAPLDRNNGCCFLQKRRQCVPAGNGARPDAGVKRTGSTATGSTASMAAKNAGIAQFVH
jgi:hypothetical protein